MSPSIRKRIYQIIFEADTPAGKRFDIALLWIILLSVIVVLLESVASIRMQYGTIFSMTEWAITVIFALEYMLRIYSSPKKWKYIFSFFGLIDFLAIMPTFISIFVQGGSSLLIVRIFRLLRVFRVLKVTRYSTAGEMLLSAIRASKEKISVFLFAVTAIVLMIGTLMYLIEGEAHGFNNIPVSMYWAIVTLTTVGYGDLTPQTMMGQFLSSVLMIVGYAIIAVPTGLISVEMARGAKSKTSACNACGFKGHDADARYCKKCGNKL